MIHKDTKVHLRSSSLLIIVYLNPYNVLIILNAGILLDRIRLSWFLPWNVVGYKLTLNRKIKVSFCVLLVLVTPSICGFIGGIL